MGTIGRKLFYIGTMTLYNIFRLLSIYILKIFHKLITLTFDVGDEFFNLEALGGGEILGKLGDLGIEVGNYVVRLGALDGIFDKAEDSDAH